MRLPLILFVSVAMVAGACDGAVSRSKRAAPAATPSAEPVEQQVKPESLLLRASDGLLVNGYLYQAAQPRALILLFHQAGSSSAEYAQIAPVLARAGYSALAIDQRSGGSLFGENRTAARLGREASYLDAKLDIEAALDWAERQDLPVILWGSSYSAALVLLVAMEHPDEIAAVLAFSPGEYLGHRGMVTRAAAHIYAPVFVTFATDPDEIANSRIIADVVPSPKKTLFLPTRGGVHGSSTLIRSKNPRGADEVWSAVMAFLDRATAPRDYVGRPPDKAGE